MGNLENESGGDLLRIALSSTGLLDDSTQPEERKYQNNCSAECLAVSKEEVSYPRHRKARFCWQILTICIQTYIFISVPNFNVALGMTPILQAKICISSTLTVFQKSVQKRHSGKYADCLGHLFLKSD